MATNREKPNVLLIYREMIPSIRLCGHTQMEELARIGAIEYQARQAMSLTRADMEWADIALLGRLDNRYELELTRRLHAASKYLIYVLDDDLLNVPSDLSSSPYYCRESLRAQIHEMLALSHAVLSPSPRLLERYAAGKEPLLTEEPAIMPTNYEPKKKSQPIHIGFAGSVDRAGDLDTLLHSALVEVRKKYGSRVAFSFFGARPFFLDELGADHIPYTSSYDLYRERLNSLHWDIGLAPMPDTPFHACKHYNKFVEYAAAGIVGIFSNQAPYTRLKEKGIPGIFAQNTSQGWYDAICGLIENDGRREALRKAACAHAQTTFSAEHIARQLLASHPNVFAYRAPHEIIEVSMPFMRLKGYLWKVRDYADIYGWRLIPKAADKAREKITASIKATKR